MNIEETIKVLEATLLEKKVVGCLDKLTESRYKKVIEDLKEFWGNE